ncbi:hypothetical protein [Mesorhizobium amorphae]|uniref:Uncharacterized protein n=1 Tax=Mesorhizobium amorphae CCNWGS0123 TaxID=1082933 RepID=G6YCD3_9HYPH|nr:hypothetical protein [Mesorhizobium amorphae]ANT53524.1 hypothetical protein A6B35_28435 [Mesorhizobium amorphae CCNWGS0123]EHH10612.1 hypothetical protein MEA186_18073 [Mesorhizobium amorphae CCNWGS0123]GLR41454.1 hypothetical protein GCM10007880_19700 [Mesorhizobium amorphae]
MKSEEAEEIGLTLPSSFNSHDASELQAQLRPYLNIGPPQYFFTKSLDPEKVIQLIGNAPLWWAFGTAATAFLVSLGTTTGKRVADDIYELAKSALKRKEAAPVANVSEALARALNQAGPRASLVVGIAVPDSHWGTALVIREPDTEKIAIDLSRFAVNAAELSRAMNEQLKAGQKPLGRAFITFEGDEVVVSWIDQEDLAKHKMRLPDLSKKGSPDQSG